MTLNDFFKKICICTTLIYLAAFNTVQGNDFDCTAIEAQFPTQTQSQGHFYIFGDILYWTARQEGLEHYLGTIDASTAVTDTIINPESITTTDNHPFTFEWKTGFRLGLGYELGCNDWGVLAIWTHFNGNGHGHGASNPLSTDIQTADGHWKLDYDVFDALVNGPRYFAWSRFSWNPFFGLSGALIKEKLHADLNDITFVTDSITTEHFKFKGLGPKIGINADIYLGSHFSLYGSVAGTLLFGHFKNDLNESTVGVAGAVITKYTSQVRQLVADLEVGIRWNKQICFNGFQSELELKLGLEHTHWFNFNNLARNRQLEVAATALTLDGVTFSAGIVF